MGDARLKMPDDVLGLDCGAGGGREHDHHLVLGVLARHRDRGGLAHRGMAEQLDLDLIGRDVLAAAADRVLQAVDEMVVAVGVAEEGIAGVEPAVAPGLAVACGLAL